MIVAGQVVTLLAALNGGPLGPLPWDSTTLLCIIHTQTQNCLLHQQP